MLIKRKADGAIFEVRDDFNLTSDFLVIEALPKEEKTVVETQEQEPEVQEIKLKKSLRR